ncbi:GNAT family N-acetyltransferase [Deinococcus enclensis]|uniref:N-acetyltransferase YhbS n=1 Tax=Deinococcus enclensis TaxID=1049582 RepID=A0ABT9MCX0_9DEIO|nr:GNAT family N-acetyltransferase [Deinococcus enclensis]MDP9764334.1 putative N-acetyltransferase YhbS [Deinococcus enclensis]
MRLRPARPDEADTLTGVAMAAKAHWGDDPAFLAGCLEVLRVDRSRMEIEPHVVAEQDGEVVGFYSVQLDGDPAVLDKLYVLPAEMGRGVGRALWAHMVAALRARDLRAVTLDADPHALPFYTRMGARQIGEAVSEVDPARRLPRMRFDLT